MSSTSAAPSLDRSIGLGRVMFQSITTMAPAASVVFGLGLVMLYIGKAAPFAMLLGAAAAVCIAVTIGQFARKIPSAGGFYSYAVAALGNEIGFLVGWAYNFTYVAGVCLSALNFSLVLNDFFDTYFHFTVPYWILLIALVLVIMAITYLGVKGSTGLTTVLGTLEVALLFVVAVVLIVRAGGANSLDYFNPATAGMGGDTIKNLFLGVVFAFGAISGFEASAPLAEETKNPRRTVPLAIALAAGVIGIFYVLAMYAAIVGWGPDKLSGYLDSPNPWREMAGGIGEIFALLVSLAMLNSVIGGEQSGFNAASRLLFSFGRSGLLPSQLGRIDARRRTPHVAVFATAGMAIVASIIAATVFDGAFPAFVFFLTLLVVPFVVLYSIICIACPIYYYVKARSEFNVLLHVVLPIIGLVVLLPTLYYSTQGLEYPADVALPILGVWLLIGIAVLIWLRATKVDISADQQRWLHEEEEVGVPTKGLPTPSVPLG
jgi:amino acid transporter